MPLVPRNDTAPDRPAVERQLDQITADPLFLRADRMTHLLRHLLEAALTGQGETLNQYTLAQDVFGRGADFDPTIDAIVRVEVGRLRTKLREYYATSGLEDPILILLPKRTYVPRIEMRGANPAQDRAALVLAVLAFDNMSGDPEQSYFADGLAEDLITDLSKLPGLSVIARQSSFAYRGTPFDVRAAGAEMGADFVVEGSVRRAGERIRINAQLIDAASGNHLWAERYDRQLIDIFAVQDDINQSISAALQQVLRWTATRGAQPRGTLNLAAWDHLLRAMGEPHPRSLRTWTDARENYDRALQLDPGYALAAARLALHLVKAWLFRWADDRKAITAEALTWAERAVALDDTLGAAHNALAWARFWSGDPDRALEAAEIAMRLAPNDTEAMDRFCMMLCWTGFPDRALEMLPRMTELNPNERYEFLGAVAWFIKGDYERAIDLLETHAEHYPDFLPAYLFLASSNGLLGKEDAAKSARERIIQINPDYVLDETDVAIFKYPNDRLRFFEGFRLSQQV